MKIKILSYLIISLVPLLSCKTNIPVSAINPISGTTTPDKHSTMIRSEATIVATDVVQLVWFYKPPEDGSPLSALSEYFDVYILTHYDEDERDELRRLGVDSPFLEYLLFVQIQDPGSCDEKPYGNQVAYKTGDFCMILGEHPDWFLRDKNGEIIRNGKTVYMDPGNLEYRDFWLERAKELQEDFGWDGVFIDNVEASMNKLGRLESLPAKYSNDESYQVEIENFLAYIRNKYFEPQQQLMYANIIEYSNSAVWFRYLQYLDGAMIEDFAVDYNERYYSFFEWESQLKMVSEAQAMGKSVIMVSQGSVNDRERERFSFASYLLVNNGKSSFRYTDSDHYDEVWLYENYMVELGIPTGVMYTDNGGWRREFTNGNVFVNPILRTSEIHLNE